MYTQPKLVLQALDKRLEKSALLKNANIFIVVGHPRSDIGKGTLVSHIIRLLPESNVIKFDGMLNSNLDNRYTARDHDDFALYSKYNAELVLTPSNHILGGSLLTDFVKEYGETNEVLSFQPYLVKYFLIKLQENWKELGKPRNLVIEIGGVPGDHELDTYVLPAIKHIKTIYARNCQIILLTELSHNNQFVKTKPVTNAVQGLTSKGICPDIILTREPDFIKKIALNERLDFERRTREKLLESTGLTFKKILSIPFYNTAEIDTYGDFLTKNLLPFIQPKQKYGKLLIGSTNVNKIGDWKMMLDAYMQTITLAEVTHKLIVDEGLVSLKENSMGKAKAYCRASGFPTIADDIGFFINVLDGQPGVAVKRWGGILPETTTNEEFFTYLHQQVNNLTDTSCYFERCISIAIPNGEDFQLSYKTYGRIDKEQLSKGYRKGEYPLGLVFIPKGSKSTWSQLSELKKIKARKHITDKILHILKRYV